MDKKDTVFLNFDQALEVICNDFRQYDPQVRLFCEVIGILSGGETVAEKKIGKNGAWVGVAGCRNMRWMEASELLAFVLDTLLAANLSPELLTTVCAKAFQTHAFLSTHPETGQIGVRIETGMEDFRCRQCGKCCRSLDYRKEVTAEDIAYWQKLGRTDIIDHVGVFQPDKKEKTYRMWVVPGTLQVVETCPFLKKQPSEDRWYCGIHDVKPAICRQYPATRKHAIMTGCPGFPYRLQ
jgi:Fe-S-cluster containining protein